MDYMTIGISALIALAVVLMVLYVIGQDLVPALNKFLGIGV